MGRPRGSRNASSLGERRTVQVRVPASEVATYEARAEALGLTVSEWARLVLRRDCGLWTGETTMSKTIKTVAVECADEAWGVLLQGATVSRVDDEVVSDDGTNVRPVADWEPMSGDWEALDDALGRKAERDDRAAFEGAYRARLREQMSRVE